MRKPKLMTKSSIQGIFEMLNLFYANKHLYEKIRKYKEGENWKT